MFENIFYLTKSPFANILFMVAFANDAASLSVPFLFILNTQLQILPEVPFLLCSNLKFCPL